MARYNEITETPETRHSRLFKEAYSQVERDITEKHLAKQKAPILVRLKPYFEPTEVTLLFYYDQSAKTDLKMLVPKLYTEDSWSSLLNSLVNANVLTAELAATMACPIEPVAFAKFVRLVTLDPTNIELSEISYFIDFYSQDELTKLTHTIENYEIVNYSKKAIYQNKLLALKTSNNIVALRALQRQISY